MAKAPKRPRPRPAEKTAAIRAPLHPARLRLAGRDGTVGERGGKAAPAAGSSAHMPCAVSSWTASWAAIVLPVAKPDAGADLAAGDRCLFCAESASVAGPGGWEGSAAEEAGGAGRRIEDSSAIRSRPGGSGEKASGRESKENASASAGGRAGAAAASS